MLRNLVVVNRRFSVFLTKSYIFGKNLVFLRKKSTFPENLDFHKKLDFTQKISNCHKNF